MRPQGNSKVLRSASAAAAMLLAAASLIGCSKSGKDAEQAATAEPVRSDPAAAYASLPGAAFAGVWEPIGSPRKLSSDPKLTPTALADVERQSKLRAQGSIEGDWSALCIPPAMPSMVTIGAQEIMVDPKKMTWIMESTSGMRWIWLDGRKHPPLDELRLSTVGHSIGHFEGEQLVIESIGFMPRAILMVNRPGNEHVAPSPEMRVEERIHLEENGQVMVSERTIYDPPNFAEPWKTVVRYERRPDWEIGETVCMENNKATEYFGEKWKSP